MTKLNYMTSFHDRAAVSYVGTVSSGHWDTQFTYTFENFFHPFVGELIAKLNKDSLSDMLDATWQANLQEYFFDALYRPTQDDSVQVESFPKEIDVELSRLYANYNWELLFHNRHYRE